GDDPEAAAHVAALAMEYRQTFKRDVFIDLVCYRKHGHNETDDPTFTQPAMYQKIAAHVPASRAYGERLVAEGAVDARRLEAVGEEIQARLQAAHQRARSEPPDPGEAALGGAWKGLAWAGEDWGADTGAPRETLERVVERVTTMPSDFVPHPKIAKLNLERREMLARDRIDWGLGETLA